MKKELFLVLPLHWFFIDWMYDVGPVFCEWTVCRQDFSVAQVCCHADVLTLDLSLKRIDPCAHSTCT